MKKSLFDLFLFSTVILSLFLPFDSEAFTIKYEFSGFVTSQTGPITDISVGHNMTGWIEMEADKFSPGGFFTSVAVSPPFEFINAIIDYNVDSITKNAMESYPPMAVMGTWGPSIINSLFEVDFLTDDGGLSINKNTMSFSLIVHSTFPEETQWDGFLEKFDAVPSPEPASIILVGFGLLGLVAIRHKI